MIQRMLLTLLFSYLFALGATWNGVLIPELKLFTLGVMLIFLLIWMMMRRGGRWFRTPLDWPLIFWVIAFAAALFANDEYWRRSVMALWYVGVYIGVWYVLYDTLANRWVQRESLVDAVMFGGLIVVVFGYIQMRGATFDLEALRFPRPGSVIGNPNALGAFLVPLLALVLARLLDVKIRMAQVVLVFYALTIVFLLFATFSRGAWIGAAVMLAVLFLLKLDHARLTSPRRLWRWWSERSGATRAGIAAAAVVAILVVVLVGVITLRSLDVGIRSLSLRTFFYEDALAMFEEQPLTGHGLFTFGAEFSRFQPLPPRQPHSHPHSGVLLVLAELGLIGVQTLALTVLAMVYAMYRNWRRTPDRQRMTVAGAIAGAAGFGAHHLIDTPAMMPLLALLGVLLLVMAVMRPGPASQRRVAPLLLAALWSVLLATGFWSTRIYAEYNGILQDVFNTEISSYREGAVRLQSVVDADPGMALYHNQQGYLFALAAAQGDESTLQCAIDAYTHFVDFEPFNATGWANLGVLTVQAGDVSAGVEALREAVRLAPSSWPIVFNLAAVVEESGETALARDLYLRALDGTSHLDPVWQATPLRREIAAEAAPAREAVVVAALMGDDPVDVEAVWSASGLVADERTRTVVLRLLLERKAGRDDAERWLSVAEDRMTDDEDRAWLALARGDYDAALDYVQPDVTTSEWVFGVNIPYFQFLRYAVPRQFVPQLYYPAAHPALLLLLGEQPVPLSQAGN